MLKHEFCDLPRSVLSIDSSCQIDLALKQNSDIYAESQMGDVPRSSAHFPSLCLAALYRLIHEFRHLDSDRASRKHHIWTFTRYFFSQLMRPHSGQGFPCNADKRDLSGFLLVGGVSTHTETGQTCHVTSR
ncbi:hypothetical protein [Hydrogenophaga sp.]|uniref:hypothetical protein n=1 Tax=Hydrogenophaga sp. TaxID=1904254 RepID=UPI00260FF501|nr:hypothetical protein [Hydrogenophaga sp.]MCW5654690.1 hypothetical protein [Hydrogenophaga sp.]